jgi:hypothetical protein
VKTGIEVIAEERQRQIEAEGYTAEHDDEHTAGELAMAGAAYAIAPDMVYRLRKFQRGMHFCDIWPFEVDEDGREKHGELRRLAIAGALIAAEIDRLTRLKTREGKK